MTARYITRALGGCWHGRYGLIPGPGHSPHDRSLKIWDGPDGKPRVHSFAADDWRDVLAWLAEQGLAEPWQPERQHTTRPRPNPCKADAEQQAEAERMRRAAWAIWRQAGPLPGTLAAMYLSRTRGLAGPLPPSLRFHPRLKHSWTGTVWPGIVAAVQGPDGSFRGIVRILINPDTADKAPVRPSKPTLGPCSGGAVRLAAPEAGRLCIGEGIESTLAAMELSGWPAWAAVTAPFLEALELPDGITNLCIAGDNDLSGRGQRAARHASRRWTAQGRTVRIALPDVQGKDWNDVLQDMNRSKRNAA